MTLHPDDVGHGLITASTQTLLLSLEMGGANWPSSCRNGTCRTCLSHLESGQVRYQIEWPGLSA